MKLKEIGRSSTATAIFLVSMTLLTTTVVSIPPAMAQGKADPPIGLFGKPK